MHPYASPHLSFSTVDTLSREPRCTESRFPEEISPMSQLRTEIARIDHVESTWSQHEIGQKGRERASPRRHIRLARGAKCPRKVPDVGLKPPHTPADAI